MSDISWPSQTTASNHIRGRILEWSPSLSRWLVQSRAERADRLRQRSSRPESQAQVTINNTTTQKRSKYDAGWCVLIGEDSLTLLHGLPTSWMIPLQCGLLQNLDANDIPAHAEAGVDARSKAATYASIVAVLLTSASIQVFGPAELPFPSPSVIFDK